MVRKTPVPAAARSPLRAGACFVLLSLCWMSLRAESEQALETDYYYVQDQRIALSLPADQIGLVLHPEHDPQALRELLMRQNLRLHQTYPGWVRVYALPRGVERRDRLRLARALVSQGAGLVLRAGLVAYAQGAKNPVLIDDEFTVKLRDGATLRELNALNEDQGVERLRPLALNGAWFLLRLSATSERDSLAMSRHYQESGAIVEQAHPDFIHVHAPLTPTGSDPLYAKQWHAENTPQGSGVRDADLDAPEAWRIGLGNKTLIAVLDFGFDSSHQDLKNQLWRNEAEAGGAAGVDDDPLGFSYSLVDDLYGWDFRDCDLAPSARPPGHCDALAEPQPNAKGLPDGHGTAVAGLAAAEGYNDVGVRGICPECKLMLLSLPGKASLLVDTIRYAWKKGAAVLSNSWELSVPDASVNAALNQAATWRGNGDGSIVVIGMPNDPAGKACTSTCVSQGTCSNCANFQISGRSQCNQTNRNISSKCDRSSDPNPYGLPTVIAVGRSTDFDCFDESHYGNCMDLLAPSAGDTTTLRNRGASWVSTSDLSSVASYNPTSVSSCSQSAATGYTHCFGGTSAATPMVAGVAGLILGANPGLTRVAVQRLLQDSADKIEPLLATYEPGTGFSQPKITNQAGVVVSRESSHGWGRVNAFEALRVAAPIADGGRGGVDIFLRDNSLDWGNTEQPSNTLFEPTRGYIPHWESVDIKVDAPDTAGAFRPAPAAPDFDAFADETPSAIPGAMNKVYVRLRNRGPVTALNVKVKLHWTQFGAALPPLPGDFWTALPNDSASISSEWHALACAQAAAPLPATVCLIDQLAYSGASVALDPAYPARIVEFTFPAPAVDPVKQNHFCLMALVDTDQDRPLAFVDLAQVPDTVSTGSFVVDEITPADNNMTQRNYAGLVSAPAAQSASPANTWNSGEIEFYLRNPYPHAIKTQLRVQLPVGWKTVIRPAKKNRVPRLLEPPLLKLLPARWRQDQEFQLAPGEAVKLAISLSGRGALNGPLRIMQERILPGGKKQVMGGLTLMPQDRK